LDTEYLFDKSYIILFYIILLSKEPGKLSGIALGYGLDDQGFESQEGLGIILFTTVSRLALGPTQLPIQGVQGALSLGVKQLDCEADHSRP
jgi:hypothetical protein